MNRLIVFCLLGVGLATGGLAQAGAFTEWSAATSAETFEGADAALNTTALEGCAAISRSDTALYFASNRPGGIGGLDIWVVRRDRPDDLWGAPANVGAPVNTIADEFCPSPSRDGHGFLYVSTKPGGCGGADIYATRWSPRGWATPHNLGCAVNSAADEASPALVPGENGGSLYFSSTRAGGFAPDAPGAVSGDSDIYAARMLEDGSFAAPAPAAGLNTAQHDSRPNLRRDGLEIFFDSNRPGTLGMADLYSAVRTSTEEPWGTPQNLGPQVNSAGPDTRPSLSWDGTRLYFGSARPGSEGSADLFVTVRARAHG